MFRPECAAGNCLPGADSAWFLIALGVMWAMVVVLFAVLAARVIAQRRHPRREAVSRRPCHAMGQAPASAVTVAEIQRRLRREPPARLPRVVTVVPREQASR